MIHNINVVSHAPQNTLGETPIYCDYLQKVIWVDILENSIYTLDIATLKINTIKLPFLCSAALPTTKKGILLLVTENGVLSFDLLTEIVVKKWIDFPEKDTRPNEAQISPNGDLFFGTMDYDAKPNKGSWYRFSSKETKLVLLESNVSIPNTLAFFDDEVLFGDTATNQFFIDKANAINWNDKKSCTPKIEAGGMDGSYFSGDNYLINARWGLSKTTVFDVFKNMNTHAEFELPVKQPTSCVIYPSKNGNKILFTSAKVGLENPSENEGKISIADTTYKTRTINRFKL
ncbi:SMP-30/gluconolactonase/LRE family protein [Tenacibaculum salmonis]|uniref:SMP-30/gluconolactonase/LRE family protein n=1 Tax=Tenacibaculum sp. P3-BQ1 TaxID=3232310 RepID=UPI0034DDEC58